MILDYIFYSVYQGYSKYKNEGEPLGRSRAYLMVILQIFLLPVGFNVAALYGTPGSWTNLIPYGTFMVFSYVAIRKRYTEESVKLILSKYGNCKKSHIPILVFWILLPISVIVAFLFAILLNCYVMKPFGLVGILR